MKFEDLTPKPPLRASCAQLFHSSVHYLVAWTKR